MTLLRGGLGLFFLYTGILKVPDLAETAQFMTRSDILPEWMSMPLACTGVAMELVVGFCLLFKKAYLGATLWAAVMTSVFLGLYAQAWARGLTLSCNCTGTTHEIINYPLDTGLRLLLLGAVLLLAWDARLHDSDLWKSRELDFSEA